MNKTHSSRILSDLRLSESKSLSQASLRMNTCSSLSECSRTLLLSEGFLLEAYIDLSDPSLHLCQQLANYCIRHEDTVLQGSPERTESEVEKLFRGQLQRGFCNLQDICKRQCKICIITVITYSSTFPYSVLLSTMAGCKQMSVFQWIITAGYNHITHMITHIWEKSVPNH